MTRTITILIAGTILLHSLAGPASPIVDLTLGLRGESGVGLAAMDSNATPQSAVELGLGPSATLSMVAPRISFQSDYSVDLDLKRFDPQQYTFSYFHRLHMKNTIFLSRTASWYLQADGAVGRLDNNNALRLLNSEENVSDPGTRLSQFKYFTVNAVTGADKRLSRKQTLGISIGYNTRRSFGEESDSEMFPTQDTGFLTASYHIDVTRLDRVGISATGSMVVFTPGAEFVAVEPSLDWSGMVSKTTRLSINAGVLAAGQYIWMGDIADDAGTTAGGHFLWLPTAEIACDKNAFLTVRSHLTGRLSGGVNGAFNHFQATLDRMGYVRAAGELAASPTLSLTGQISWMQRISQVSAGSKDQSMDFLEEYPVSAMMDIAMEYALTKDVRFQLGIRGNIRTTDFHAATFRTANQELILYSALTGNFNLME